MDEIDNFSRRLSTAIAAYTEDVAEGVKSEVDSVAKEMYERIKSKAPKRPKSGKYQKAMRLKTVYEDKWDLRKRWYVAKPFYRLTHLLEHGHATRNGGYVRGQPHIGPAEEWAQEELEERVRSVIEDASK